jgi:hypothetical protein
VLAARRCLSGVGRSLLGFGDDLPRFVLGLGTRRRAERLGRLPRLRGPLLGLGASPLGLAAQRIRIAPRCLGSLLYLLLRPPPERLNLAARFVARRLGRLLSRLKDACDMAAEVCELLGQRARAWQCRQSAHRFGLAGLSTNPPAATIAFAQPTPLPGGRRTTSTARSLQSDSAHERLGTVRHPPAAAAPGREPIFGGDDAAEAVPLDLEGPRATCRKRARAREHRERRRLQRHHPNVHRRAGDGLAGLGGLVKRVYERVDSCPRTRVVSGCIR